MNRLANIDFLRVLCIILLVTYHSFAIYSGSWVEPKGVYYVPGYYWIGKFCYSFMLPLWVFLSGYLWSYQVIEQKKLQTLKGLVNKKSKKLLFPCYFFGILYLFVINKIAILATPMGMFSFLSGMMHLWFLPMLFWVFIISYFLQNIKLNDWILLIILWAISIVSWNIKSLGIGGAFHYLIYFQMGYMTLKYRTSVEKYLNKPVVINMAIILFVLLFVPLTLLGDYVTPDKVSSIQDRCISQVLIHLVSFPISFLGITIAYIISIKLLDAVTGNKLILNVAKYSFSIYIFHQFILMYLYYRTNVIEIVGNVYLPFLGIIISILCSILLARLCIKTKLGRALLL